MSKPINCIKLSSSRTDQTTENNSQEIATCLFSRKRRSKGHEQELREDYYSRHESELETTHHEKLLRLIYLTVIYLLFSDLTNGFSRKYATLSRARFKEKGRDKKNKKAAYTVAPMKFLLNFQTQKTTQERIIVESFFLFNISSAPSRTTFTPG